MSESIWFGLLLVNFLCAAYMSGVIALVQWVHYPLMDRVRPDDFVAFEKAHVKGMGFVVGPVMIVELISSIGLGLALILSQFNAGQLAIGIGVEFEMGYLSDMPELWHWGLMVAMLMTLLTWFCTWLFSVPCHRQLEKAWDACAHRRLVQTNWPRTYLWFARVLLVGAGLFFQFKHHIG